MRRGSKLFRRKFTQALTKALFHREQDDIVPLPGPLLALFPRSKEVDMGAEGTPDGLNRGHVLSAWVHENEGDHCGFRMDFLHPRRADTQPNRAMRDRRRRL